MVSRLTMETILSHQPSARLHLTNVSGVGATQLLQSLLPALEHCGHTTITQIYLPYNGALANYLPTKASTAIAKYRRWLPNAVSRLLECTLHGWQFDGGVPLFVLGDLPIRCNARQTVFVQTSHLLRPTRLVWSIAAVKFLISRMIFRINLNCINNCIVQTEVMKDALISSYPALCGRVHVVSQPVPIWLQENSLVRKGRVSSVGDPLILIYPASSYPHKNHKLLSAISLVSANTWPVQRLVLTVDNDLNPAPKVSWIDCVGLLSAQQMIQAYACADALVFLSKEESYGFPLVESMFVGLPIICPDLPYSRHLCGNQAIYFNPNDIASLKLAVETLQARLDEGWWPNWSERLTKIPKTWSEVADEMLKVVSGVDCEG